MKLHLPKQLFTALLAALTLAAPATLTLGSTAWGASEEADPLADETTTNTTTAWDANWGELEGSPVLSDAHICTDVTSNRTAVNGSFYMIDESFESGEKVVVDLQDSTNSNMNVVGGFATQTGSNDQGDVNREVWIKATSGNYNFLIGGNYANNWSNGSAANFAGDTHILVDGAAVTVGSVVGANHFDSQSPTFTGDTYISVMNGTITGDIIGSGTATHNVGTNQQTGHTHVFVYNEQTSSGYVTGGGLSGGFDGQNRNQKLTLNGDTHVTVDLSGQSGALTFAKHIVGAHVYKNTSTPILSHTGTTNITLIGNSDSDTKFTGQVIGGNYSGAGGTLTVGSVNMSIGANVEGTIVGGNYALSSNVETVAENITITVGTNGHAHQDLYGGHYVGGSGSAGLSGSLGDVAITLEGGIIEGAIYGGSWIQRNNASASVSQGNIHIDLSSGNLLGDIYAAGYQEGSSTMTTASTKVSVDSAVTITSGKTISGGYKYASGKSGSTVTGTKTLVFNGASQDRSSITFDSFDTFQVTNADAEVTLSTLTNVTNLTKTGSGKLTLSGALGTESARLGTVSATGGELALSGTGYVSTLEISGDADVRVASGGNLNVTTFNASTGGSANTNRNVYVEAGATVTAATLNVNWNMGSVEVNGALNVTTELYLGTNNDDNITGLFSGTGVITASKLRAGNWGSYGINVATLKIGADGLVVENGAVLNLASATTTVAGTTTVNSGNVLNFKAGSATLSGSVTNNGSINVNGGSLTLENGISGSGTVALLDGGQLTVSGGTATFANTLSMGTGAALTVSGGTANVNGSFNVTGTNVVVSQSGDGGVLNLSGGLKIDAGADATLSGRVGIGGTIVNNGSLTLNGTIQLLGELSAYTGKGESGSHYELVDGTTSSSNDGFLVTTGGSYWLTQNDENVTEGVSVTLGQNFATVEGNKVVYMGQTACELRQEGNHYYFTTGATKGAVYHITSTAGVDVSTEVQQMATGGYSLNGGTMNITSGSVDTSEIIHYAADSKIQFGSDDAKLIIDTLPTGIASVSSMLNDVVTGSIGTVVLNSTTAITYSASDTDAFRGRVQVQGNDVVQNGEVVPGTSVELQLGTGQSTTVVNPFKEIILKDGASIYYHGHGDGDDDVADFTKLSVTSGTGKFHLEDADGTSSQKKAIQFGEVAVESDAKMVFTSTWQDADFEIGKLSGEGSFHATGATNGCQRPNLSIVNLEEFGGSIVLANGAGLKATLSTGGTAEKTVNFNSLTATGLSSFQFNVENDTTVASLSVSGNNNLIELTGEKTLTTSEASISSGSLVAGKATIANASAEKPATMSNVKVSNTALSGSSDNVNSNKVSDAAVAIAQLQQDASFTIEDMTLTNTTITAATPTTQVNFRNVTVTGATVLRNMQASMTDASVAPGGSEGVKGVFTASTSLLSGITLANTGDAVGSTITVDLGDLSCAAPMGPGKYDLSITLSGFTMEEYSGLATGAGLVFAADSWLGSLLNQAQNANVQMTIAQAEAGAAAAAEGGSASGVTYSTGNVGTVITITGLNVPEPASATLGLAALMMLCARRRRKA